MEPMYFEFTRPLLRLGHEMDHFDHIRLSNELGAEACGERLIARVKAGGYDCVLFQTAGKVWMPMAAIAEAGRFAPIIAWNSDDDWQWKDITSKQCPHFSYMVTTYRHVWQENKAAFPNLLLSQWGCLTDYAESWLPKEQDFTFVGFLYGSRIADAKKLGALAGLRTFGAGSTALRLGLDGVRGVWRIPKLYGRSLPFAGVNHIWNTSKISWTPMNASRDPSMLQIKGRTFGMGLSGTLMICQRSPGLDEFYEPEKEYVPYTSVEDCADKVKYLLKHDDERKAIVRAYLRRTLAEHLWEHRFQTLFSTIGLK